MKPITKKQTEALKLLINNKRNENLLDLTTISEDLPLLGSNFINHESKKNIENDSGRVLGAKALHPNIPNSIAILKRLVEKETVRCAKQLNIDKEELEAWINVQIEVPAQTILTLLRTSTDRRLDPLREEITLTRYEDGNWQANISIDGWIKLLNQDPQFNGVVFKESDNLIDGVPEWVECSIFRKDHQLPVVAKEYLTEVKSEQPVWQKMPRRMLRHRALQQCARFYF